MAARLLANLVVISAGVMVRAFAQAYRQALTNLLEEECKCKSLSCNVVPSSYSAPRLENNGSSSNNIPRFQNASKNGVAQEAVQNIRRASKAMTESEARQVLGVAENTSWEEVVQKYNNLFESNAKNGSFYLQSKVHRAKECLESLYRSKAEGPN